MVEIHPRRGAFIPHIFVEVQLKILEVRRGVEELAVRLAAQRADALQKADMGRLAGEMDKVIGGNDLVTYGDLLRRINEAIVMAARNDYLLLAMAPLQGLSRRFWFANVGDQQGELAKAARLHCAVLEHICLGEAEAAAQASLALNDYLTDFAYRTIRRA
nr:FCD domain-containing protein [Rhodospirillum rubrum]